MGQVVTWVMDQFTDGSDGSWVIECNPHYQLWYDHKVKQCGALWRIRWNILTTFFTDVDIANATCYRVQYGKTYDVIHKTGIYNIFHRRQKRTEPRSQLTCTENFMKFGRVIFFRCASGQTDRHTETLIAILRTSAESGVITSSCCKSAIGVAETGWLVRV